MGTAYAVSLLPPERASALLVLTLCASISGIEVEMHYVQRGDRAAAVPAGLTFERSNVQVKGQVHRLKRLKRQMQGRAGCDLPQRPVIATA